MPRPFLLFSLALALGTLSADDFVVDPGITVTPAMVAGLTDHVWSMEEWLAFPSVQH